MSSESSRISNSVFDSFSEGFKGTACQSQSCIGYDSSNPEQECSGHGSCVNGSCNCDDNFSGHACDSKRCIGYLTGTECGGHGECLSSGVCRCNTGWKGLDCSTMVCAGSPECSSRGMCLMGSCVCNAGWKGETCDIGKSYDRFEPYSFQLEHSGTYFWNWLIQCNARRGLEVTWNALEMESALKEFASVMKPGVANLAANVLDALELKNVRTTVIVIDQVQCAVVMPAGQEKIVLNESVRHHRLI